ncbi:FMN-binding negative transcriptional regulator [Scleromatobacter humisilvae]|uniref:FMN-binding negative transcriptional regulator n=1 Tax=Scleromatobacter humisilvae TaxID=2897159 RepID=A0A9X1YLC3_9BURK|nr:FMN-binding negative transcriptional regulator [Scleromatobacter humisilvae]MCK9687852.1 FMN-binding negative transcriptional regulator [Scleromatobacter humisilvae]
MYQPAHFVEQNADTLLALMQAHPLATLIRGGAELAADILPLEVARTDAGWRVTGHVARANPLWREADGQPVLLLFQGPQAYVSPNWYPSKFQHGKAVPTWNYAMVQVHGRLRAIEDPAWLRAFVTRLTERHEGGRAVPWQVSDAPADYIDTMLKAIVGIEIEVTRVEGKFKLSQNRSAEDRTGVVLGLESDASQDRQPEADALAQAMQAVEQRRRDAASK